MLPIAITISHSCQWLRCLHRLLCLRILVNKLPVYGKTSKKSRRLLPEITVSVSLPLCLMDATPYLEARSNNKSITLGRVPFSKRGGKMQPCPFRGNYTEYKHTKTCMLANFQPGRASLGLSPTPINRALLSNVTASTTKAMHSLDLDLLSAVKVSS